MWIANLVWLFHMAVICFVVLVPFLGSLPFVLMDLVLMLGIGGNWLLNSDVCCLTELECALRGMTDRSQSFFGRLVGPVYGLNNNSSQWIGLTVLISICIWRLLKERDKIKKTWSGQ